MLILTQHGQRELKRRALTDAGLNPDAAAMALDDLLAEGQADPGAAHGEEPLCPFSLSRDRHPWGLATVLDRIADQVLKHLAQLCGIGGHRRQISMCDQRTTLLDGGV